MCAPTILFTKTGEFMATHDAEQAVVLDPGGDHSESEAKGLDATPSKPLEIVVALVATIFMGVMLYLSLNIELRMEAKPGQIDAGFWPAMLSILGLALAVWRLGIALFRPPDERDDVERIQEGGYKRLAITLGLMIVYVAAWSVGSISLMGYRIQLYPIITALLFMILVWVYGGRKWTALILYPVAMTALIYFLFGTLLRIPL